MSFWDSLVNKDDKTDELHAAVTALPDNLKEPTAAVEQTVVALPVSESSTESPGDMKGKPMENPTLNTVVMDEAEMEKMLAKPAAATSTEAAAIPVEVADKVVVPTPTEEEDEDEARAREYADAMGEGSVMRDAPKVEMAKVEAAAEIPKESTIEVTPPAPTEELMEISKPSAEDVATLKAKQDEASEKAHTASEMLNTVLENDGEFTDEEIKVIQNRLEESIRKWAAEANRLEVEVTAASEKLKADALELGEKVTALDEHVAEGPAAAVDDEADQIDLDPSATPEEKKRGGFLGAIARWYERGTRGGRRERVNNRFSPVLTYADREFRESGRRGVNALRSAGLSVGSVAAAVVAPFAFLGLGGLLAGDAIVRGVGGLRTTATGVAAGVAGGVGMAGTVLGGATRETLGRGLAAGIRAAGNVEEVQNAMQEQNAAVTDARISKLEEQIALQNQQMAEMLALLKKQATPSTETNA